MRVTRLEIFGFKSFMERLILPVEDGVTGIVGPNGCGKSNIVDALRWVLGETRAKNLRGGVLEDVIFNGTDKLRPLGLAEVTITLRAKEDNFFADLVSPSLEADLIARQAEDLIDTESSDEEPIEESIEIQLDQDGKPRLTVIDGNLGKEEGQDNDEEVSAESSEEKSSADAATLLTRYSWLKSINEVQITRRLYRSGESEFFINRIPCRLKDLKDFFRAVGLGARSHTIVAQGEVGRIVTAKPDQRRLILEEAAGVLGFRDKIAAANRRLDDTEVNVSRLDDIIKEVTRQVNSLKRQALKARKRQELRDRVRELDYSIFTDRLKHLEEKSNEVKNRIRIARDQETLEEASLQTALSMEEEVRSSQLSVDVEADRVRKSIDDIKEELTRRLQQRSEKQSRLKELGAFMLARETDIKRIELRKETLDARHQESGKEALLLRDEDSKIIEQLREFDSSADEEGLKGLNRELAGLREELKAKERELRSARDRLISNQSSLRSVKEQLIAASPVNQLRESLGDQKVELLSETAGNAGLFIDGLEIPSKYIKAVQTVVAERAQFLVASNPHELARKFVEDTLRQGEETSGLGLGVIRSGEATLSADSSVPFPHLASCIEISPECTRAAARVFSGIHFASNLDAALNYFESNSNSEITLVTADGDLVTSDSFFSLRHEGGLVQLKSRASELERECGELEAVQRRLTAERSAMVERIELTEQKQQQVLSQTQEKQRRARELSQRQGEIRGRLEASESVVSQIRTDLDSADGQIREARLQIREYLEEIQRVEAELESESAEDESAMHQRLRELNEEYMVLDESRREGRGRLHEVADQAQGARRKLDAARSALSKAQLDSQKIELELQNIEERVVETYGEEVLSSLCARRSSVEFLSEETLSDYNQELLKIKHRIQREGEVDPSSIERCEEEVTRLEELTAQREDLSAAAKTLRKTIEMLRQTSEQRFVTCFDAIKENFSKLIPRLFGGGKGSLELTDPGNPLESGVDILVRPPGKKPKNIELLSGGEKALCATALILGMFMERPSPLCVLDEVDAPLDDANLVRFLSLIKEMSAKTQFVMITHNKQSMQMADNLVGVTMQQPGASNVLSVSLQEAYKSVA